MNKLFICLLVVFLNACTVDKQKNNTNVNIKRNINLKFGIEPEFHNFGTLETGEIISFSFKINNHDNETLIIDSIDGGCGCIEIDCNKKILKKNEETYLTVIFNSSGEWGNIYKPIRIYTNSIDSTKDIYITAKVNNKLFN